MNEDQKEFREFCYIASAVLSTPVVAFIVTEVLI